MDGRSEYIELIKQRVDFLAQLVSRATVSTGILNAKPAGAEPSFKARLLLVDDNEQMRLLIPLQLPEYDVRVCSGYESAMQTSLSSPGQFALLIADLEMKPTDGESTVRALLPDQPKAAVLFISGKLGAPDRIGGHPLLRKPFAQSDLRRAIETILRNTHGTR